MKVGILTHHYINNYGAFLQTYALQETIKLLYPNEKIYVINYIISKHKLINILGWYRISFNNFSIKSYIQKIRIPNMFAKFSKMYLNLTNKVFSAKEINNMNFDTVVIGSDEVWNYADSKSYSPVKFGYELSCKNIITYAPSAGNIKLDNIQEEILLGLNNIKYFSSRDDNSELLISKALNKRSIRVLDPTFLYDFPIYESDLIRKITNEKYILVYYCDNIPKNLQIKIIEYAKQNNLKIYGAGDYKNWFDKIPININPFEWVELFRSAEKIFTGTFHGCVFSIKFNKPFYTYITNKSRSKKIESLLNQLTIKERALNINTDLDSKLNYKEINLILKKSKKTSINYLINAIKGGEVK